MSTISLLYDAHRVRSSLPVIRFPDDMKTNIGKIIEGAVLKNIATQKRIDGSAIKKNAASTRKMKRRKRRLWRGRVMSLVDDPSKHRLIHGSGGSYRYSYDDEAVYLDPANAEVKNIIRWVQEKGYTGWFGISDRHRDAIAQIIAQWIIRLFNERARRLRSGSSGGNR